MIPEDCPNLRDLILFKAQAKNGKHSMAFPIRVKFRTI
jgi:hypothetical protein